MRAEIITIGDEVLSGRILDTNAVYLARQLTSIGIDVQYKSTVGDDEEQIEEALRQALKRVEIIVATGGLGPTEDDLTKKVFARVVEQPLVLNEEVLTRIQDHFQQRGLTMPGINIRQALIPRGAHIIENRRGTAPGLIITHGNKEIIALPGPPVELMPMVEEVVMPYLKGKYGQIRWIGRRTLKVIGLAESKVNELISNLFVRREELTVGLQAHQTHIEIHLTAQGKSEENVEKLLAEWEQKIGQRLGENVFGRGEETLEMVLGSLLTTRKCTLAVAESCTGGQISYLITNVPGSSQYFLGSVVAYGNQVKSEQLGVPTELLETYGAVSSPVATAMAERIRTLLKADLGIGVTGIAGPTGGTPQKPVGLVFIALAAKEGTFYREFRFLGSRDIVRARAAHSALDMVRRYLLLGKESFFPSAGH